MHLPLIDRRLQRRYSPSPPAPPAPPPRPPPESLHSLIRIIEPSCQVGSLCPCRLKRYNPIHLRCPFSFFGCFGSRPLGSLPLFGGTKLFAKHINKGLQRFKLSRHFVRSVRCQPPRMFGGSPVRTFGLNTSRHPDPQPTIVAARCMHATTPHALTKCIRRGVEPSRGFGQRQPFAWCVRIGHVRTVGRESSSDSSDDRVRRLGAQAASSLGAVYPVALAGV